VTPDIARLAHRVREAPCEKLSSLMGMVFREEGLRDSFRRLPRNKAPGVDGVRKDDYGQDLDKRLDTLSSRLRDSAYVPRPGRRVYIPKLDGGRRPLGIPAFEDRLVQDRVSQILQAIWEVEFKACSFGFRPGRGAHDALRELAQTITCEPIRLVVEADIKGFFNHVDHDWMMKFLKHRIADQQFLRLIHRFLKAGVMEDGAVKASEEGTPQGGLASPTLANIYLHYVLDLWFEHVFRKSCRGAARLVRYADDFVVCFEYAADADAFMRALPERLGKFGLETEPSKTKTIRFGKWATQDNAAEGKANESFNFLGFTHYLGTSRRGGFLVGRKTEGKRVRKKLKEVAVKLKSLRTSGGAGMYRYAQQHLQGHYQYYGISGNSRAMSRYLNAVERLLFKWLNRRSQRRSIYWRKFQKLLKAGLLPAPRIYHDMYTFFGRPYRV
jgi:RNA-directed DNA polymerase